MDGWNGTLFDFGHASNLPTMTDFNANVSFK